MTRNFPGETRCAVTGCGLTRSAKVHKVQKAAATGAIATVTITDTLTDLVASYTSYDTDDLVRDVVSLAAYAVQAHAAGKDTAEALARQGIRRAVALTQRADAPTEPVPAVFAAQVAAILATAETEQAATDAPLPRWADRQRAPKAEEITPEQHAAYIADITARRKAEHAAARAARVAELAAGPVPQHATWVYAAGTTEKIGWLSDAGFVPFPAPVAEEAPAPVVVIPCGSRKRPGRVRAAEKYCGPYARSARLAGEAVAERTGARVITLSARFGLLEDDDLVDDYDLTMGDVGAVTAGRIAEQAARLGITDSLVTVIAGKAYADVVSAVWPHAVRALDGCTSYGNQRARMGEIARGTWSPATPAGATAAPALFGAQLVAPDPTVVAAAGDLVKGDVLAPGTFGETYADPVLVVSQARPVDQPGGRRRVTVMIRSLTFPGRGRHLVVWADTAVDVVGRDRCPSGDWVHPPAEEAEILDGPGLSWPRLITGDQLRTGDVLAPGALGPWNKTDTVTVVTDPKYVNTVMGARRFDIGYRVNLRTGTGPEVHGAIRNNQYVAVLERPTAIEAPAPAPVPVRPAPIASEYITLPIGTSLPEHGALPQDTVVVLARSKYWDSRYRTNGPDSTMHIACWGLPTVSLCRATLVKTEGRESYVGRDGETYWKHSGRPAIAGRDDARFGYVTDSDCESCKRAFARTTRETLPARIRYPMIDARRADRARRAAERAARLAGDVDPTTVEPVDLAQVAAAPAQPLTSIGEAEDLPVPVPVPVPAPRPRPRPRPRRELAPVSAGCGATSAGGDFRSRVLRANRHTAPGVAGLVDPVNLHDYDVVLVNVSAGKDSMALLVAIVKLALAQGYDLGRIIAVHCDLGRVEWAGTAELAEEHAREMGVNFIRVANKVDLLDQVRQRKRNLVRKADELREAAEAARAAGDVAAASLLAAQSAKKAATPAWYSSTARYCTKSQKTGEVEKLMTALAKVWREAGNTDRPIRILNTLGIRADESPARALKKPFGPDSATNTRRTVTRWLPIFTWSEEQVWATIRASNLRVHGAYQINMSRLSCALCVLGSRQDLVTAARANRGLVDEYADVEDEVEATFQNGVSVREIGAEADRLGPLELPAPASLNDLETAGGEAGPVPARRRRYRPMAADRRHTPRVREAVAPCVVSPRAGIAVRQEPAQRPMGAEAPGCSGRDRRALRRDHAHRALPPPRMAVDEQTRSRGGDVVTHQRQRYPRDEQPHDVPVGVAQVPAEPAVAVGGHVPDRLAGEFGDPDLDRYLSHLSDPGADRGEERLQGGGGEVLAGLVERHRAWVDHVATVRPASVPA
jgi:3'-phosphoadenosine 5'-phosphosulfate sulfotransferase (PAPS reductase)/FAD synthetase